MTRISTLAAIFFAACMLATAQTSKNFTKDNLSFDYPEGWTVQDDSNNDAQQFTLAKPNSDSQIRVFVHKGRVSEEKLPEAKKAFIDPYIAATAKQFVSMGAKPEQSPAVSEIGGVKADGVNISASLGGDPGAAKIYWAVVGQRVAVLTIFGPDRETNTSHPPGTSSATASKSPIQKPHRLLLRRLRHDLRLVVLYLTRSSSHE